MTTPIETQPIAARAPVIPDLLDDLLRDAELELESADLHLLGEAVGRARVELVRHCIEQHIPPLQVVSDDPDTVAPTPCVSPPSLSAAETVAKQLYIRYEELAPSFGHKTRTATAIPWEDTRPQYRLHLIATAAAVLSDMGATLDTARV